MGLTPSISYTKLVIDVHVVLSILDLHSTVLISMKQKRNYQTAHRIEDTRSQVQYTRHPVIKDFNKTDIYHKKIKKK